MSETRQPVTEIRAVQRGRPGEALGPRFSVEELELLINLMETDRKTVAFLEGAIDGLDLTERRARTALLVLRTRMILQWEREAAARERERLMRLREVPKNQEPSEPAPEPAPVPIPAPEPEPEPLLMPYSSPEVGG